MLGLHASHSPRSGPRSHLPVFTALQVWDIRTKQPIHVLSGHTNTVNTVVTNSVDPQIISGSSDSTIKVRTQHSRA